MTPCAVCKRSTYADNLCNGCGAVICERHGDPRDQGYGGHNVEDHEWVPGWKP